MSNRLSRIIVASTVAILMLLASFWGGGYISSNRLITSVHGMQAKLAFRHFTAYEEVRAYVHSGCASQAIERLDFLIDQQKMLMAEYIQEWNDVEFEEYVSSRYLGLIEDLRRYDIDWSKELIVTRCD